MKNKKNLIVVGATCIDISQVASLEFEWNASLNDSNLFAYTIIATYFKGFQVTAHCNKNGLCAFLGQLDNEEVFDNLYSMVSIEGFIEDLKQAYFDKKTCDKIKKNNEKSKKP